MSFSDDEGSFYDTGPNDFDDWENMNSNDWPGTTEAGPSSSQRRRDEGLERRRLECHRALCEVFGHPDYKGKQKEIVEAAVSGMDVFVLAPTGMGKSLCFQIPAASDKSGVTVVISPLLALMNNQVAALRKKGVCTYALTSETSKEERQEIFEDLASDSPKIRLLYTTPERLVTPDFMGTLAHMYDKGTLNRLVVDEAHCISEWGHDFREEFRRIGAVRNRFPEIPIMALTATATPDVQKDIIRSLRMTEDNLFKAVHPFNRANLYYEIRYTSSTTQLSLMTEISNYIQSLHVKRGKPSSGIIYCRRRRTCDELADFLRRKGLSARPYHRGLPSSKLDKTLKDWTTEGGSLNDGIDVVVATVAFGLGIDKGDVRYIIHYDVPKSLEGYYQETGRAGRNGSLSKCIMYYSREDVAYLRRLVAHSQSKRVEAAEQSKGPLPSQRAMSSVDALVEMAENVGVCRHVSICRYFGETINVEDAEVVKALCDKMCDVCKYPEKTRGRRQNLSSEEHARTQAQNWRIPTNDDDDERGNSRKFSKNETSGYSGTSLGMKRAGGPGSEASTSANAKKPKVSNAYALPTLVTKPFSSASTLVKPFKPPLMKTSSKAASSTSTASNSNLAVPKPPSPPKRTTTAAVRQQDSEESIVERRSPSSVHEDSEEEDVVTPARSQEVDVDEDEDEEKDTDAEGSIELDLPTVFVEIEEPISRKVDPTRRRKGMDTIRVAIHKALKKDPEFVWSRIKRAPSSAGKRDQIIAQTAKEVEYDCVLCFISTEDGYKRRLAKVVECVGSICCDEAWTEGGTVEEEYEEVQAVVEILKRACKL